MNDAQRKSKLVFVFSIFVLWDFFELKVPVIGFYWLARSLNWKTPLHIDVYMRSWSWLLQEFTTPHCRRLPNVCECVRALRRSGWCTANYETQTLAYSTLTSNFCFFSFSFSFSNSNGNPFGWCALHYRSEASTNVRATYMNRIKYDQYNSWKLCGVYIFQYCCELAWNFAYRLQLHEAVEQWNYNGAKYEVRLIYMSALCSHCFCRIIIPTK